MEEFTKDKHNNDGKSYFCRSCEKERRDTPAKKKYMKEYLLRPEVEEKSRTRRKSPEYKQADLDRHKVLYLDEGYRKTRLAKAKEEADKNPEKILVKAAKVRAKKRNIPFSLEPKDILIPIFCPVFGLKLEKSSRVAGNNSPTIDRILPKDGYVPGNIEVISWRANRLRGNGDSEDHFRIAEWMKEFLEGKYKITRDHQITEQERTMVHQARIRAKKDVVICSVNPEDVLIPKRCPVFHTEFFSGTRQNHLDSPSLDRVNPDKGYTKDNICVISWKANKMKSDGTEAEHRSIAEYLRKFSEIKELAA